MRSAILILPLALAACDVQATNSSGADGKDVHINLSTPNEGDNKVSVNVPGFNANVRLPTLNIGGHVDLDGVKLAPDSAVKGMDILGGDKNAKGDAGDHGSVRLRFTNPKTPASIIAYYRAALVDAGFTLGGQSGDRALTAAKDKKNFALALTPDGSGSRGTITIVGD